jgi:hypothetical protein
MQVTTAVKSYQKFIRSNLDLTRGKCKKRMLLLLSRSAMLFFAVIAFTSLTVVPSTAVDWSPESIDRALESFLQRQYPNLSTLLPYVKSIKFSTQQTAEGFLSVAEIKCDSITEARQATYAISVVRDVFALALDQGAPIKVAAATIETPRGKGSAVFSIDAIKTLGHVLSRKHDQDEWARAEVMANIGQLETDFNKLIGNQQ